MIQILIRVARCWREIISALITLFVLIMIGFSTTGFDVFEVRSSKHWKNALFAAAGFAGVWLLQQIYYMYSNWNMKDMMTNSNVVGMIDWILAVGYLYVAIILLMTGIGGDVFDVNKNKAWYWTSVVSSVLAGLIVLASVFKVGKCIWKGKSRMNMEKQMAEMSKYEDTDDLLNGDQDYDYETSYNEINQGNMQQAYYPQYQQEYY